MDIEQRLQGLTHTVELLAGMQLETEKKLQRFIDTVDNGMTRLLRIMDNHEDRISDLEDE